MKPYLLYFLLSLLTSFTAEAQTRQARVVDAESGEPIPFAHIYLRSSEVGTVSNINGYFRLTLPNKPDTLQVTCIGYSPVILPLERRAQLPAELQLKPSSQMLQELVISNSGPDAEKIMRKVIDRYFINHGIDACNMKTFMRTTMQRNGEYVHLLEADGWVYNGGAPASQLAYFGKHMNFLEFTTHEEVRLSDQKYIPRMQYYNPAYFNSYALIWDAADYDFSLESVQEVVGGDVLYTIKATPSKKLGARWRLKRKTVSGYQRFYKMDRMFVVRAEDYAVLEVRVSETLPKKKDGISTDYPLYRRGKTKFMDKVSFLIKYDQMKEGVYRPYYMRRHYEYTDIGLTSHPIDPLRITEQYEMFFTAYDTSRCEIEELRELYETYRPYERKKTAITLEYKSGRTESVIRPVLAGVPSPFRLNGGYMVRGRATYDPAYWEKREKTLPPYEDKEKLFSDLAKLRPVDEQFADFHARTEEFAKRMLELYGDDPYVKRVMEYRVAKMKSRYRELFDESRDY